MTTFGVPILDPKLIHFRTQNRSKMDDLRVSNSDSKNDVTFGKLVSRGMLNLHDFRIPGVKVPFSRIPITVYIGKLDLLLGPDIHPNQEHRVQNRPLKMTPFLDP